MSKLQNIFVLCFIQLIHNLEEGLRSMIPGIKLVKLLIL
jgi:hypothetical protein